MAQVHPDNDFDDSPYRFPGFNTLKREKPRRWPLVLRLDGKGIHNEIVLPILLHSLWNALITFIDLYIYPIGIPGTIIPTLSVVVGLILVFRNSTSYDRFWQGRNCLTGAVTGVCNLSRNFMVSSRSLIDDHVTEEERLDTEVVVRHLLAFLFAVKHHLRREYATEGSPSTQGVPYPINMYNHRSQANRTPDLSDNTSTVDSVESASTPLLSRSFMEGNSHLVYTQFFRTTTISSLENKGVALPLQLTFRVEAYIRRGLQREWWRAPQASMLQASLSNIVSQWQKMDTIRSTPIPTGYIILEQQVLALYLLLLPFAMVDVMGWSGIPVMALAVFTLYGIEGVARILEDPFGYDKMDIKLNAIVEDAKITIETLLSEWKMGNL